MEGLLGRLLEKLKASFGGPHTEEPDSLKQNYKTWLEEHNNQNSDFLESQPDTTKNIDKLIAPKKKPDALLKAIMRFGPTGSMKDWS